MDGVIEVVGILLLAVGVIVLILYALPYILAGVAIIAAISLLVKLANKS